MFERALLSTISLNELFEGNTIQFAKSITLYNRVSQGDD
jgi:hypothetical protein